MFDTQKTKTDFGVAAKYYASYAGLQEKIGRKLYDDLAQYISADHTLLDVGAGSGELTSLWPAQTIALDMAWGMCQQARAKGMPAICARGEQLPLKEKSIDVVTSNLMLQWLNDPQMFFAEARRVLKPDGILAITSFTRGTLRELEDAFGAIGEHGRVSEFSANADLQKLIVQAGFEVLQCEEKIYEERYEDVMALCQSLKNIGAANKRHDRPRGMLTPRKITALKNAYPQDGDGICGTWMVCQLITRKIS